MAPARIFLTLVFAVIPTEYRPPKCHWRLWLRKLWKEDTILPLGWRMTTTAQVPRYQVSETSYAPSVCQRWRVLEKIVLLCMMDCSKKYTSTNQQTLIVIPHCGGGHDDGQVLGHYRDGLVVKKEGHNTPNYHVIFPFGFQPPSTLPRVEL